jgi:hypothetical protein
MTRRLGLALTFCLVVAIGGRGDGPTAAPPVERLIEQLGSPDFKTRESANKVLAERGGDALPALRNALPHPDPEVRQRLSKLIADAERVQLLAPKRVSVKFHQTPISEAMAELTRQTGYRIVLQSAGPQQLVTLQMDNAPFWEVFDKVCAQNGLVMQQYNDGSGGLMVYAQNAIVPFVDYRGPFRLSASSFQYYKSNSFATVPLNQLAGAGPRAEQLTFMFSVVAEPKLPILGLGQPQLTQAVDDLGNSLMPNVMNRLVESQSGYTYYGYRNFIWQTQVQLGGSMGSARSVKLLRGTLPVTLLAEQKPEIVIDDILQVKGKKFDGPEASLEIENVTEAGNIFQVAMTARNAGATNDYNWYNSLQQRLELVDDKGNKFQPYGLNTRNVSPTSMQGTVMFSQPGGQVGKPVKLTYYGWVLLQHQVEFEFRDLPLP